MTDQRHKYYTRKRANECYKCLKLLPETEDYHRDLSEFNEQYEKSVIELANATGEDMPARIRLSRNKDRKPQYSYTVKVIDGEEQLDVLQKDGMPFLVEEEYYKAANDKYNLLVRTDSEFSRLSTLSMIRKIQSLLLQEYIFNADLLLYLDKSKPIPNVASGIPSSEAFDTASTSDIASTANAAHSVTLNGSDAGSIMGSMAAQFAKNAGSVTFVNVESGATNIGVQHNGPTDGGTPEWAKRLGRTIRKEASRVVQSVETTGKEQQISMQEQASRITQEVEQSSRKVHTYVQRVFQRDDRAGTNLSDQFESAHDPEQFAAAFASNNSSPEREAPKQDAGVTILEQMVRNALEEPNLEANIEYYKTHDPDMNDPFEVSFAARLSKVCSMMHAMEVDPAFLVKQLSGLTQCQMDGDDFDSSQSWNTLAKGLSRALYFFGKNNQVVMFNEGAILEKDKNGLLSLVLPIAGFGHQTNVHVGDRHNHQLTVTWSDNNSKDSATALFALIQIALARQGEDVRQGIETPSLVQVEVPAEGNKPAAIVLSPDQFSKLTDLSGCSADEHSIEFKQAIFTVPQQGGLLKTAGQIVLTNCVLHEDGQGLSQTLWMGADNLVLWQLTLFGNFPFGVDQALKLIDSCNKTIVIGSGAAAELLKQEFLVDRLKKKAARNGIYYDWKFDFGSYSSDEKQLFRDFLADVYTGKLQLSENCAAFAQNKAAIIQHLSTAFDEDDPDGETYDWPFDLVDVLPRSQHQVELANYVKDRIELLAFDEEVARLIVAERLQHLREAAERPSSDVLGGTAPLADHANIWDSAFINPGSWKCSGCLTRNDADKAVCGCCESLKPGANAESIAASPPAVPVAATAPAVSGAIGDSGFCSGGGSSTSPSGFGFQAPAGTLEEAQSGKPKVPADESAQKCKVPVDESIEEIKAVESGHEAVARGGAKIATAAESEETAADDERGACTHPLKLVTAPGGGFCFKPASPKGDICGEPPALVEENEATMAQVQASEAPQIPAGLPVEEKELTMAQVHASEVPQIPIGFSIQEKEPDAAQVQASEARQIRKFHKNDTVKINDKVEGNKCKYIGQIGTVVEMSGPWVYVKLLGENGKVAFYPKWLQPDC